MAKKKKKSQTDEVALLAVLTRYSPETETNFAINNSVNGESRVY